MTTAKTTRTRRPRLEAGAVATEQTTTVAPSDGDMPQIPLAEPAGATQAAQTTEVAPVVQFQYEAALTGPEQAELRNRNDAIDWARDEANRLTEQALKMRRLADLGQAELNSMLTRLFGKYNLDPSLVYRADIDRGVIIPTGQAAR